MRGQRRGRERKASVSLEQLRCGRLRFGRCWRASLSFEHPASSLDSRGGEFQVPVALQRPIRQPDRFSDKTIAQARRDSVAKFVPVNRAAGQFGEPVEPRFDIGFTDTVPEGSRQQQCPRIHLKPAARSSPRTA